MDRLTTLPSIHTAVWQALQRAVHDRHHAWRTPVLATAHEDGGADARTVVLREVDSAGAQLVVYSDARAAKLRQAAHSELATLVFWSPRLSWQLRMRTRLQVHTDGLRVSTRWAQVQMRPSAQDYLSPLPPGAVLAADDAVVANDADVHGLAGQAPKAVTAAAASPGAATATPSAAFPLQPTPVRDTPPTRTHFAVILADVLSLDWLELHRDGHRRARFDAAGQGQWLVP